MAQTAQVFSAKTLAERWECSENTIRNMIKTGKLKSFKVGGSLLRIKLDEVLEWESADDGSGTSLDRISSDVTGVARSLSGTMRTANVNKSNSVRQTKALQELNSINSRLKPN